MKCHFDFEEVAFKCLLDSCQEPGKGNVLFALYFYLPKRVVIIAPKNCVVSLLIDAFSSRCPCRQPGLRRWLPPQVVRAGNGPRPPPAAR